MSDDSPTMAEIGRRGGAKRKATIGSQGFSALGKVGGKTTRDRHGPEHYAEIGRKGGMRTKELMEVGKRLEEE
jgi:hypothetical protein